MDRRSDARKPAVRIAHSLQGLDTEAQSAILALVHSEAEAALQEVIVGNEVVWPSYAHIARATR